jgi:DNA-binding response OmpR family regulator
MREMLVIEGDEEAAELYAAIFTQPGWNVDAPHSGRGVAEILLGSKHYNITLVSYHFPGTNGMEIIRLVRELEHRQTVPVLMATGHYHVTGDAL